MKWPRSGLAWGLRLIVREIRLHREQLTRQNDLLERLADHFAPIAPAQTADGLKNTGVDYLDEVESVIVQDYTDRTKRDLGREPTDAEILTYLADERTRDLHQRLQSREEEMARLSQRDQ